MSEQRQVVEQIRAQAASDGDGVKLLRVFGGLGLERFDPFLMLDEFGSEEAADYIGGFPPHPHRGFQTVTYMLQGKMEHRDHMGNIGLLDDGGVQWMNAGRGIIHSEMPKQTEGRMRGFQLWVNLPAEKKMLPAGYQDIPSSEIPVLTRDAFRVKAISGTAMVNDEQVKGFFSIPDSDVLMFDFQLPPEGAVNVAVENAYHCLAYVYDGKVKLGKQAVTTTRQTLTRFNDEGVVAIQNAGEEEARVLLLAGKPIGEPIVQHGPFVMNSAKEIDRAILDYREGRLTG